MSRPLRVLFSYHYYKDQDVKQILETDFAGLDVDVFFDSGAFSAWTTGTPITVDEYAVWLKKWGHLCTCAAALDVISDTPASYEQTEALRKILGKGRTYPLIPVFHSNDEGGFIWLEKYLRAGYDYIGISPTGAIYKDMKLYTAWLRKCFAMRKAATRYHGFGVTHWKLLRSFPWYSVDSTTWMNGFFYAQLKLFDPARGMFVQVSTREPKSILNNIRLLASYDLSARDVRADKYDRAKIVAASIHSWQRAEDFLGTSRIYLGSSHSDQKAIADGVRGKIYLGTLPGSESMQSSPISIATSVRASPLHKETKKT